MDETNAFRTTSLWIFIYKFRKIKFTQMYACCLLRLFFSFAPPCWLVLVICFKHRTCIRVYVFFFCASLRSFVWRCHSTLLLLLALYICHDTIHCFAVLICQTLHGLRSANQRATHLTFDQIPHLTVRPFAFGIQRSAISIYKMPY